MESSQELANKLILGEIAFQRVLGDPAIAAHTGASNVFMLRVRVKDARGRGSTEARTNSEYRGARFDGGSNYTNRLAAAQAAPRFKLWLECGKPTWAEFHRGLSDDAKEELKRQGKCARDREANIMAGKLGGAVKRRRSIDASAKWGRRAEEWARLHGLCAEGVKQIMEYDAKKRKSNDDDSKLIKTYSGEDGDEPGEKDRDRDRAGIERMQRVLQLQAFACAEYFKRLQERNQEKAKRFRERAEALRALVANEDDDTDGDGDGADDDAEDAAAEMDALVHAANSPDPTEGVGVHDIADDVARIFFKSGRTLRAWAKEFMTNETFALDLRGTACGEHLLEDEDVKRKVKNFMSKLAETQGARGLTVYKFWRHVNDTLLPELVAKRDAQGRQTYVGLLDRTLKNEETGAYSICTTTAHAWMKRCGAKREWHKQGAYTDVHEDGETKKFRKEYLVTNQKLQLREPTWVRMEKATFEAYKAACTQTIKGDPASGVGDDYEWKPVEAGTPHAFKIGEDEWVELHVDDFEDTEGRFWATRTVSVRFADPDLARPPSQRRIERDIAMDRQTTCEFGHSGLDGTCKCHLPIYRLGHDEAIFKAYALPKGVWVIDDVMTLRKKSSGPGEMVSAVQDEHRGFGLKMTEEELAEVNDYRRRQGRAPLDESPGIQFLLYGKNRDGYWDYEQFEHQAVAVLDAIEALHPNHQVVLEVDWSQGHAKKLPGGLYVSDMNLSWGTTKQGYTPMGESLMTDGCFKSGDLTGTRIDARGFRVDRRGDAFQSFIFKRRDPINPVDAKSPGVKNDKHIEQPKGLRQVLWERGLWDPETEPKLTLNDARQRLRRCEDFANQQSALQQLFSKRGHILLMSPKAHPELAGKGIEYSWGKAKRDFRQHNDCVAKNLHDNVLKSFDSLPLERVRKFARKTREYMRAYAKSHMLFGATEADRLEGYHAVRKFVKGSKTHRCTLDQDYAFVGTA